MAILAPSHPEATVILALAVIGLYLSLPELDSHLRPNTLKVSQ